MTFKEILTFRLSSDWFICCKTRLWTGTLLSFWNMHSVWVPMIISFPTWDPSIQMHRCKFWWQKNSTTITNACRIRALRCVLQLVDEATLQKFKPVSEIKYVLIKYSPALALVTVGHHCIFPGKLWGFSCTCMSWIRLASASPWHRSRLPTKKVWPELSWRSTVTRNQWVEPSDFLFLLTIFNVSNSLLSGCAVSS